ncbi:hypothetical protein BV25DRAFT_1910302 [Artomyces pyxidatus]|uniref:Uncharacterized protein n=1 Tax=Artomyces pyxidatus TaxID=48021 RepID=A0ACB8TJE4_9AGAM|nr:hypothetical protein BV25DRAFT_1910302 [Artomyces pyxidatus]
MALLKRKCHTVQLLAWLVKVRLPQGPALWTYDGFERICRPLASLTPAYRLWSYNACCSSVVGQVAVHIHISHRPHSASSTLLTGHTLLSIYKPIFKAFFLFRSHRYNPYSFSHSPASTPSTPSSPSASSTSSSSSSSTSSSRSHHLPRSRMYVKKEQTPVYFNHDGTVRTYMDVKPPPSGAYPNTNGKSRDRVPQLQVVDHTKWGSDIAGAPRLSMRPIMFDWIGAPSGFGVSMNELLAKSVFGLGEQMVGGHERVFGSLNLNKIAFRIGWPGYAAVDWNRPIELYTRNGPITRVELAVEVANQFARFVEKATYVPCDKHSLDWRVSPGYIRFDHLILVALVNISGDSWQADIIVEHEFPKKTRVQA